MKAKHTYVLLRYRSSQLCLAFNTQKVFPPKDDAPTYHPILCQICSQEYNSPLVITCQKTICPLHAMVYVSQLKQTFRIRVPIVDRLVCFTILCVQEKSKKEKSMSTYYLWTRYLAILYLKMHWGPRVSIHAYI